MRILLLHPNFPGQFRQRALDWAAAGHDVRFLCQTHFGRQLPGVKRLCLKHKAGHDYLISLGLKGVDRPLQMAKQYLAGFEMLQRSGWTPDVVVSHTGWGCGLHAALAFPDARRVGYVEWWFKAEGSADLEEHRRNMAMALELAECDQLVAPTEWQRAQLPRSVQSRCTVVVDGVDATWFQPSPALRPANPLLTYGTRGMEPTRGFPEFIKALPPLLKTLPDLRVEIAGEDRICYAGKPPEGFRSYGQWAKQHLERWQDRVTFVGRLEAPAYREWLQRSWLHVYLTKPFVASWSLLEAMACGCCLIASDSAPVREFTGQHGALLVQGWEGETLWLVQAVQGLLTQPEQRNSLQNMARTLAIARDQVTAHQEWEAVLAPRVATSA